MREVTQFPSRHVTSRHLRTIDFAGDDGRGGGGHIGTGLDQPGGLAKGMHFSKEGSDTSSEKESKNSGSQDSQCFCLLHVQAPSCETVQLFCFSRKMANQGNECKYTDRQQQQQQLRAQWRPLYLLGRIKKNYRQQETRQ